MSIVEVLIAAALLLVIALGILALLTRAMANNNRGWEATVASNHIRSQLDNTLGEAIFSPNIDVTAGNESVIDEWWAAGTTDSNDNDEGWYDTEPTDKGLVLISRQTTVQQFNVKNLMGGEPGIDEEGVRHYTPLDETIDSAVLPGGTDQIFIHVKRVSIQLTGERQGGPLGAGQRLRAETYLSF